MLRVLTIAALLLCTSNCNSIETVAEVDTFDVVPNKKLPTGVSYYLPKKLVRIKFTRAAGQRATASDKIDISIEPAVADTRYRFTVQGSHLPSHDSQFNILVTDKGLLSVVHAKVQDRLPEITANLARFAISVSAGIPLAPVAPAASRFAELVLDPLSSAAARSEGNITGEIDEGAEVSTVPDTGVNMTGEKVVADAQRCVRELEGIEARLSALPRRPTTAGGSEAKERLERKRRYLRIVCNCPLSVTVTRPTEATWIIDPARYSSVLSVNCELQKLGSNLRVRVLRWPDARKSYEKHTDDFAPTSHAGVVYRAPTDYKVAIIELRTPIPTEARRSAAAIKTKQRSTQVDLLAIVKEEHNFVLPNGGPIRTLPFRYSMCSVAGYQVQFVDGMPVRQQIDHRSELAACSAIPLQIISDIIEAPINMLDFQTKRLQKEKSLEDARRQLEESRRLPGPANP